MESEVEIEDNSEEVEENLDAALLRGLEAIGMMAETYAKQDCPVDTGRLRNSIAHAVNEQEKAAYIGSNAEYAAFVEYGHHRYAGAHMLKNAAANHGDEYKAIIEESMKNA